MLVHGGVALRVPCALHRGTDTDLRVRDGVPPSLPPARSGGAELDRFVRRHGLLASGGAAVLGS